MLRRVNGLSVIDRAWPGATVFVLGGGPSITQGQCDRVAKARSDAPPAAVGVIAVNDAYRLAPWADVCYFADSQWWAWHKDRQEFKTFAGQKCSISDSGGNIRDPDVHIVQNGGDHGISLDPQRICTGRNSLYQAMNIAILAGAGTVVALGMDGKPADDGRSHWFGDHVVRTPDTAYEMYRRAFNKGAVDMKAAARIINCSPGSAVDVFEKMSLEDVLEATLKGVI